MNDFRKLEKTIRNVSLIALLLSLGVLFVVLIKDNNKSSFYEKGLINYSNDWNISYEDSEGQIHEDTKNIPVRISSDISKDGITITKTLPEEITLASYLYVLSYHQDVDIYIDGEMILSYGGDDAHFYGKVSPRAYISVPLEESYAGKTVKIHYNGEYLSIRQNIKNIFIGTEKQFSFYMYKHSGVDIFFGITFIVIGLVWLLIFRILYSFFKEYANIFYLGYFALLMGFWILFSSDGRQIYMKQTFFAEKASYILLATFLIPLIQFIDVRQNHKYRKSNILLCSLLGVNALSQFVLDLFSVVDLYQSVYVTMVLIVIVTLYVVILIVFDYFAKNEKNTKELFYGVIVMGFCGILKTISSFASEENHIIWTSCILYLGALILVILFGSAYVGGWINAEKKKRELEHINKTKNSFLANMSHEIRTPITAILGMDEMILKESEDENILEYANKIHNSSKILLSIINDILDFSKIESGKMTLNKIEYESVPLLSDVISIIKANAENKKLEFKYIISEDLPTKLYGDDIRIRQILINILNNAVKYTRRGSVTLEVICNKESITDKTANILVKVTDTGVGIKKEDMGRLFEAFDRIDEKYNRNVEGTGLGMNITSHFLSMMDSSLKVESEYGKGSTFSFEIVQSVLDKKPVGEFEKAYAEYENSKKISSINYIAPDAKVLIVDDNNMNLEVISGLLKDTKMQITTADRGMRAIELFKEFRYDIILLDHMMPGMDGIETLSQIRAYENEQANNSNTIHVPVVVLTANAIAGAKEMYMEKGFQDYVVKPIVLEDLLVCMKKLLPSNLIIPVNRTENKNAVKQAAFKNKDRSLDSSDFAEYYLTKYGISIGDGVKFSAGKTGKYKIMLSAYMKFDKSRREKLISFIENEDMEGYAIEVHALKGNARSIGANALGEVAFEHEKRSKAKELDFVKANFSLLMDEMDTVMKGIAELVKDERLLDNVVNTSDDNAKTNKETEQKIEKIPMVVQSNFVIGNDKVKINLLNSIKAYTEDYDRKAAIMEIDKWIKGEANQELINLLKLIRNNLEEFDFEIALKNIDNIKIS